MTSKIAVVGAGYVGLTTGACLSHLGHDVVCVDVDEEKVALVRTAAKGQPITSIGALKQQFGDQVTYEDLHLIRAWLARK